MFARPKLGSIEQLASLKGKNVVITGAASGIGEAIAYRFGEAGASLSLIDIDQKGLTELQTTLMERNAESTIHRIDLRNKNEIDAFWDETQADILVNNAGIYPIRDFLELDPDFYDNVLKVNLNQVLWMCQHFIKKNLKKGGVILNVSSIEAILPFKGGMSHYSISKMGVLALTRGLARDYGKKGLE